MRGLNGLPRKVHNPKLLINFQTDSRVALQVIVKVTCIHTYVHLPCKEKRCPTRVLNFIQTQSFCAPNAFIISSRSTSYRSYIGRVQRKWRNTTPLPDLLRAEEAPSSAGFQPANTANCVCWSACMAKPEAPWRNLPLFHQDVHHKHVNSQVCNPLSVCLCQ